MNRHLDIRPASADAGGQFVGSRRSGIRAVVVAADVNLLHAFRHGSELSEARKRNGAPDRKPRHFMNGKRCFYAFGEAKNRRRRKEPDETVRNCSGCELLGRRKRSLAATGRQKSSVKREDLASAVRHCREKRGVFPDRTALPIIICFPGIRFCFRTQHCARVASPKSARSEVPPLRRLAALSSAR